MKTTYQAPQTIIIVCETASHTLDWWSANKHTGEEGGTFTPEAKQVFYEDEEELMDLEINEEMFKMPSLWD